jgi:hypothetical protein
MHPYIPHLLSDILNAHQIQLGEIREKTIEEELEEIEEWVESNDAEHTFSYWCGLVSINFLPQNS